jgi:hypothetical protein
MIWVSFEIAVTSIEDVVGGFEVVKTVARGAGFQKASSSLSVLTENRREHETLFSFLGSLKGVGKLTC